MSGIGKAIKQTKPFKSPEHEVFLTLERLANRLGDEAVELFKPYGLSGAQYNVLRILRGAGGEGLACGEVGERLITKDPDVTRLLDRLEKQGFVSRSRSSSDRRVVTARITESGLAVLAELDAPLETLHRQQLSGLGEERLQQLLGLLEALSATDEG